MGVAAVRPRQRCAEGQAVCTRRSGEASCLVEECRVLLFVLSRCCLAFESATTSGINKFGAGRFTSVSVCVLPSPALPAGAMMFHCFVSAQVVGIRIYHHRASDISRSCTDGGPPIYKLAHSLK